MAVVPTFCHSPLIKGFVQKVDNMDSVLGTSQLPLTNGDLIQWPRKFSPILELQNDVYHLDTLHRLYNKPPVLQQDDHKCTTGLRLH